MKMKNVLAMGLASCAIVLAACSSTTKSDTAAAGMVNSKCPYSGHAADAKSTSDFNGQKVGFCCGDCKAKFDKADAKTQGDLVAKVKN
ncbi:MAG: hypothetical protein AABZ53_17960 [Planctomycetota bacterium]